MTHGTAPEDMPLPYVVARVREALVHDERVAALDLHVRIVGADVFLSGTVASSARRDAAEAVVRDQVPDLTVHNQLDVIAVDAPAGREEIS
jgi:osmotically-inducible protein OsmY